MQTESCGERAIGPLSEPQQLFASRNFLVPVDLRHIRTSLAHASDASTWQEQEQSGEQRNNTSIWPSDLKNTRNKQHQHHIKTRGAG